MRIFSSRQLMGDARDTAQLMQFTSADGAMFGSGKSWAMRDPVGEIEGTVDTGPLPRFGTASHFVFRRGVAAVCAEKFPSFSCTVGTLALRNLPRFSWFHSSDQKKNNLSFMIGPPKV